MSNLGLHVNLGIMINLSMKIDFGLKSRELSLCLCMFYRWQTALVSTFSCCSYFVCEVDVKILNIYCYSSYCVFIETLDSLRNTHELRSCGN